MPAFMRGFESQTYALMRIVVGLLFLWHGTSKLFDFPTEGPPPDMMPTPMTIFVGSIELFGGLLVMVGLLTRWAAFLCSGLMAFAYWIAHGRTALFPIENGGELAILYCFVFLYIAAKGPGIWSADGARGGD
jgi:putative oxidoreductase